MHAYYLIIPPEATALPLKSIVKVSKLPGACAPILHRVFGPTFPTTTFLISPAFILSPQPSLQTGPLSLPDQSDEQSIDCLGSLTIHIVVGTEADETKGIAV
jgi:hypothetical protein